MKVAMKPISSELRPAVEQPDRHVAAVGVGAEQELPVQVGPVGMPAGRDDVLLLAR